MPILVNELGNAIHILRKHLPVQLDDEVTILLNMDKDLAAAMNKWRLAQQPSLDPTTAVHELLRRGLIAEGVADPAERGV